MGTQTTMPCAQAEDCGLLGTLQSPNWVKVYLLSTVFFLSVSIVPRVEKCLGLSVGGRVLCLRSLTAYFCKPDNNGILVATLSRAGGHRQDFPHSEAGNGDEMLPQTPWYLLRRSHIQQGSENQNWNRYMAVSGPPDFSEKTQTEVVRARHIIIWTGRDCHTGNGTRRETKRQTEETMGRQHQRVDWP